MEVERSNRVADLRRCWSISVWISMKSEPTNQMNFQASNLSELTTSSQYHSGDLQRKRRLTCLFVVFFIRTLTSIEPFPSTPSSTSLHQNNLGKLPLVSSFPMLAFIDTNPPSLPLTSCSAVFSLPVVQFPFRQSSHLSTTNTSFFSLLRSTSPSNNDDAKARISYRTTPFAPKFAVEGRFFGKSNLKANLVRPRKAG